MSLTVELIVAWLSASFLFVLLLALAAARRTRAHARRRGERRSSFDRRELGGSERAPTTTTLMDWR